MKQITIILIIATQLSLCFGISFLFGESKPIASSNVNAQYLYTLDQDGNIEQFSPVYQSPIIRFETSYYFGTVDPTTGTYYMTGGADSGSWSLASIDTLGNAEIVTTNITTYAIAAVSSTSILTIQPAFDWNSNWELYSLDPTTQQQTLVDSAPFDNLDFQVLGAIYVPESGILYGVSWTSSNSILNIWNTQTGEARNVSLPEEGGMMNSLAWSEKDQMLYAVSQSEAEESPGIIYTIDPSTLKLTQILPTIYVPITNMVIDDEQQVLYYIGWTGTWENKFFVFVAIDLPTRQITGIPISDQTGLMDYTLFGLQIVPTSPQN